MAINYPAAANNPIKRLAYMLRVKEKWRRLYNLMGLWFTDGITLVQYNTLPVRIKNKIPYTSQLTGSQWKNARKRLLKSRAAFTPEFQARVKAIEEDGTYNPDPTDALGDF